MGDVIDLKPKPTGLLALPRCPIQSCSKCGRDDGGWISRKYGCATCAPEMEEPTSEISHWASRASLLEAAVVYMHRAVPGHKGVEQVLKNLMLRVEGESVVSVLPEGDPDV